MWLRYICITAHQIEVFLMRGLESSVKKICVARHGILFGVAKVLLGL